ncbi:hypothetical protein [Demequina gelatinilytica]|uniref:hypothetical protein n=1 Tax=Demequina gelatinilytica TaxID=1638980 RepID=UPI0007841511|nr:hypothetical protein [Demequina gelatinilytica]
MSTLAAHDGASELAAQARGDHERVAATRRNATRVLVAYVALWVLEGAVRKWGPGALDTVFYIARDAMLIGAIIAFFISGAPRRRHPWWTVLWISTLVLVVHGSFAMMRGSIDPVTLVFGWRAYLVAPLLVVFAATYAPASALASIADTFAVLALVSVPLVTLQVFSPASSWANQMTQGEEATFLNAGEVVRPAGTFSSPSGFGSFVPIALALSLATLTFRPRRTALHGTAVAALAVMSAVSGSRSIVVADAIVIVAFLYIAAFRLTTRSILTVVGLTIGAIIGMIVVSRVFAAALDAFSTRVDQASNSEDSGGRVWNNVTGFLSEPIPLVGTGAGAHSTAGVQRLGSIWVEIEKQKMTAELGLIGLGLALGCLAMALWAVVHILVRAHSAPPERLLILAIIAYLLAAGTITQQPTSQGAFAILVTLVVLTSPAVMRDEDPPPEPDASPPPSALHRGT